MGRGVRGLMDPKRRYLKPIDSYLRVFEDWGFFKPKRSFSYSRAFDVSVASEARKQITKNVQIH